MSRHRRIDHGELIASRALKATGPKDPAAPTLSAASNTEALFCESVMLVRTARMKFFERAFAPLIVTATVPLLCSCSIIGLKRQVTKLEQRGTIGVGDTVSKINAVD